MASGRFKKPKKLSFEDDVRFVAQATYGEKVEDEDGGEVIVQGDPPTAAPGGYWVKAKLWIPSHWLA